MNTMSLSRLYQLLASRRARVALSADDMVALNELVAHSDALAPAHRERLAVEVGQSQAHADLLRMLNALKPESEALARDVRNSRLGHRERARAVRTATGRSSHHGARVRWIGALAACLSIAIGVWSWQHEQASSPSMLSAHATPAVDRIFTSNDVIFAASDDSRHAIDGRRGRGDEVFRGHFSG